MPPLHALLITIALAFTIYAIIHLYLLLKDIATALFNPSDSPDDDIHPPSPDYPESDHH